MIISDFTCCNCSVPARTQCNCSKGFLTEKEKEKKAYRRQQGHRPGIIRNNSPFIGKCCIAEAISKLVHSIAGVELVGATGRCPEAHVKHGDLINVVRGVLQGRNHKQNKHNVQQGGGGGANNWTIMISKEENTEIQFGRSALTSMSSEE